MNGAKFDGVVEAFDFILAGNATFTLVSGKTGQRYTYKVRHPEKFDDGRRNPSPMFFVSLLSGPDNTSDYTYLGMILHNEFKLTKASKLKLDSKPVAAFAWMWNHLTSQNIPPSLEIWHEGRCGRCGRVLTVPESIASGFGPECIERKGELQ